MLYLRLSEYHDAICYRFSISVECRYNAVQYCVFWEHLWENWPHYNGTALYIG